MILNNSSTIEPDSGKATAGRIYRMVLLTPSQGGSGMTPGLFLCGTDTDVGKTAVATAIVRHLVRQGVEVGVCKPVASGVGADGGDPQRLWEAAGCVGSLEEVCPQAFPLAVAPARAAAAAGRSIDEALLVQSVLRWQTRADCVVVEGAGGLYSPLSASMLNADLARAVHLPLVVCDDARLGAIGRTLAVVTAARSEGHRVAAVVLSQVADPGGASREDPESPLAIALSGVAELQARLSPTPVLLLGHHAERFEPELDWLAVARGVAGN